MNPQRLFRRAISVMSNQKMEAAPFTKAVVAAMRQLYPEKLADSTFDNTGLLLEAPYRPDHLKDSVLLTIDLTTAVADEAIAKKVSIIVAYHPIIFKPLKSLTSADTQQMTLLRLVREGISVYSPHTAVDAVPGGLNDWLADIVTGKETESSEVASTRTIINPVRNNLPGFEGAGYGRIVRFQHGSTLKAILSRITKGLNVRGGLSVAVPQKITHTSKPDIPISSIGICAGSGGSMLHGLDVALFFTGELSHHETLAAIEKGIVVVTAGHSNTERVFLKTRLCGLLRAAILDEITQDMQTQENTSKLDVLDAGTAGISVDVSDVDRDPFEIIRIGDKYWE